MTLGLRYSFRIAVALVFALLITGTAFVAAIRLPPPPVLTSSSREVQLTYGAATRNDAVFSPDGKYVVYSSNQSGNYSIWIATTTKETQQTRLTKMSGEQVLPEWDMQGNNLAFLWKHDSYSDLCIISEEGKGTQTCITSDAHVGHYSFSRDGLVVAYDDVSKGDIRLYSLMTNVDTDFQFNGTALDPAFGNSSGVLYFSGDAGHGFTIWKANTDGSNLQRLSWEGSDSMPQVSPSGDMILFLLTNQADLNHGLLTQLESTNTCSIGQIFNQPTISLLVHRWHLERFLAGARTERKS